LEKLGYQVIARLSSQDALAVFKEDPARFDLVITDMTMPNMNGLALSQGLLSARPDIPIILCTGFSERVTNEKAKALGIRELLLKPADVASMAKMVRKVLDNH
jgi:CheY-like chemotaxis protein